ncbi:MAG TPA: hypothetical protein VFC96_03210 [Anaerovoracaceae bacterium]|nr:hypothetical protein [Anaerovoracaceae bacterium]
MDTGIITIGQLNLIKEIRRFWEQQVMWMRFYIQSAIRNDPDMTVVLQRLFANSQDFFYLLLVFFGRAAAERFASFITAHMSRIVALIDAMKNNDQAAINQLTVELNQNANNFAAFLGQMNPFWEERQWRQLLQSFVGQTIDEIVAIMAGQYEEGVRIFDNIENIAYEIADYLAKGIISSFIL